ncbi:hypothetical protein ACIP79_03100 [Streptomyces sp. NPDC088747]|uniref:hypothetical protein n=1 Tax=Streptomyces sp. NPDC088747 TaxID=3365886 RepID=UPI0037F1B7BF
MERIGDSPLAGTLTVGNGSLKPIIAIAARTMGSKHIPSASPSLFVRLQSRRAPRPGVTVSAIWGGTLKDNEVEPTISADFLPAALTAGTYQAAPKARIAGHGLTALPEKALQQLKKGVSATKLVVPVSWWRGIQLSQVSKHMSSLIAGL